MNIRKTSLLLFFLAAKLPILGQIHRADQAYYYPDEALDNKVQGKVYVEFLALPTGQVVDSSVAVVRGLGYGLDEMAVEAIKEAPSMKRNKINQLKKDEPTRYVIPIVFQIQPFHWSEYHLRKAEQHLLNDQQQAALESIKLSLSFNRRNADAHYLAFKLYRQLTDRNKACASLKRAKRYDDSYLQEWTEYCR